MSADEIFLKFYNESFPAVSYETRSKFISFLAKNNRDYKWLYSGELKSDLSQGDIVGSMPIFFFDGDNIKSSKDKCYIMLLQHTCDMSVDAGGYRNTHYVFAPVFNYDNIRTKFKSSTSVETNTITNKFFIGGIRDSKNQYLVDLNLLNSISAEALHRGLKEGKLKRIVSLSDNGYLFLLAKLTVHFLRAEEKMIPK